MENELDEALAAVIAILYNKTVVTNEEHWKKENENMKVFEIHTHNSIMLE